MGAPQDDSEEQAGWRHNPKVAIVAAAVALVSLLLAFSCLGPCRGRPEAVPGIPQEDEGIAFICPHCQTEHAVTNRQVRKIPGPERFSVKLSKVPCPKCGRTGSLKALTCKRCGKYFCPIADDKGTPTTTCPHCGDRPW